MPTRRTQFSQAEWLQYFGSQPYQVVCPNWRIPSSVIAGMVLPILSDESNSNRVQDATIIASQFLLDNPTNPEVSNPTEVKTLVVSLIEVHSTSSISGVYLTNDIKSALVWYENAKLIGLQMDDYLSGRDLHYFCRKGSLAGYAQEVLEICEFAVNLNPTYAVFRDSRGLARALSGDYSGAIEDFQFFVDNDNNKFMLNNAKHGY